MQNNHETRLYAIGTLFGVMLNTGAMELYNSENWLLKIAALIIIPFGSVITYVCSYQLVSDISFFSNQKNETLGAKQAMETTLTAGATEVQAVAEIPATPRPGVGSVWISKL